MRKAEPEAGLRVIGDQWEGTHIRFALIGKSDTGKTNVWEVQAKIGNASLGMIRWYGRWRGYAFYPSDGSIFEHRCMIQIAEFMILRTRDNNTNQPVHRATSG